MFFKFLISVCAYLAFPVYLSLSCLAPFSLDLQLLIDQSPFKKWEFCHIIKSAQNFTPFLHSISYMLNFQFLMILESNFHEILTIASTELRLISWYIHNKSYVCTTRINKLTNSMT